MSAIFRSKLVPFLKKESVLCISAFAALVSMFFVPPSPGYLEYIDLRVLALLFCLMVVVAGFQKCGLFAVLAQRLLTGRKRLQMLSLLLVLLPFFSSMLITNDVALITFVPFTILVLHLIGHSQYLIRLVVLQTIAANLGSMATPVGNPQNLFLYAKYGIPLDRFFAVMAPLTLVSLIGLAAASLCVSRETIQVTFAKPESIRSPKRLLLFGGMFLLCLLSVFHLLHYAVLLVIVCICLLTFSRDLFRTADYGLLLTFVCFFIFAGNVGEILPVREFLSSVLEKNAMLTATLTSQVISNVPAAVLLSGFTEDWRSLLLGTNIGGLGTPIASLASLISLKFYLQTEHSRPAAYLAVFLGANLLGLVLLYILAGFLG